MWPTDCPDSGRSKPWDEETQLPRPAPGLQKAAQGARWVLLGPKRYKGPRTHSTLPRTDDSYKCSQGELEMVVILNHVKKKPQDTKQRKALHVEKGLEGKDQKCPRVLALVVRLITGNSITSSGLRWTRGLINFHQMEHLCQLLPSPPQATSPPNPHCRSAGTSSGQEQETQPPASLIRLL